MIFYTYSSTIISKEDIFYYVYGILHSIEYYVQFIGKRLTSSISGCVSIFLSH
ncbi:type ISP restriction/modification enzyme [Paenibacillus sp. Leaf72]|uniref:type ISP restriction/modification enzyme n=1 Tax=Paenibacillus sp. Leaf72 TaxID=1736234 RepID=UPI00138F7BAD